MNDPASPHRPGVPAGYPGRIVDLTGVSHVVCALFGIESPGRGLVEAFAAELHALAGLEDGPQHVERAACDRRADLTGTIVVAYWHDRGAYQRWWHKIRAWWAECLHRAAGETACWREVLRTPSARFQYAAGSDARAGAAAMLPLAPCTTFGYWGAYRDRLPAAADDDLASALAAVPPRRHEPTRGRRLRVVLPDNLCFIREGQGWGECSADELALWQATMEPALARWVEVLAGDPAATGCLAIRDCRELDVASGQPKQRRSQFAWLLSLAHIEQAARTTPAHLAVHDSFVALYRAPRFVPRMHVWVEVHVVKHGEVDTEYVNCDPGTGLLPYFTVCDVSEGD